MQRHKQLAKKWAMFLGAVIFLMGAAPMFFSIIQAGGILLMGYGACLFGVSFFWDRWEHPTAQWWRRLRQIVCALLGIIGMCGGILSFFMLKAAWMTPPAADATVVVLGCQIVDGQPSKMLRLRLEKALDWLQQFPDAKVVCTGGLSPGEQISEGEAMKNWLIAQGIAEDRIFVEGRSKNTKENLSFSAELIKREGLNPEIAIASDGFHQLRAQLYAKKQGLTAGTLPSPTPWGLLPSYWVREWMGIAKAIVYD